MNTSNEILSDITVFLKYAKHLPDQNRRETWEELVTRNKEMHLKKYPHIADEIEKAYKLVYAKKVLPSMRSMQFAGKPIEISPTRIFNCAYLPIDDWRAFSETMFLLLGGTGVGYSVQQHHVEKLPEIRKPNQKRHRRFVVGDSIEGWADAIKALMKSYFNGTSKLRFDLSDIRPKGARLITSGGKAPGSQPLQECLTKVEGILMQKEDGSQLTPLEVHDIICHIADAVLAGGIRRAALISLFSVDDNEMMGCKSGSWWEQNPQRGRANNSVVLLRHKLTKEVFLDVWKRIELSGAGEPGFYLTNNKELGTNPCCFVGDTNLMTSCGMKTFAELAGQGEIDLVNHQGEVYKGTVWSNGVKNVVAVRNTLGEVIECTPDHIFMNIKGESVAAIDLKGHQLMPFNSVISQSPVIESITPVGEKEVFDFNIQDDTHWGVVGEGYVAHNCEISLKPTQFCNLTEVNASDISSQEDFNERVRVGAFIGTLQADYTDFHYLRESWKRNTEKEALIGVSMTGIASGTIFNYDIESAADVVNEENIRVAKLIGINPAARTTTVKPAGTTSLTLGTSSGIHAWHNDFYIRRIRIGKNESLYSYLAVYHPSLLEDDYFKPHDTAVISIPQKAPNNAILRTESPDALLERIKLVNQKWIKNGHRSGDNSHNVSATVSLKEQEWESVGEWMWENREYYNGLSVLPYDGGTYVQAPFEDCTEEVYNEMVKSLRSVDLTQVIELDDNTDLKGEAACAGGACEIK